MKIRVLFFAQLKEAFGKEESVIEVKEGMTVGELAQLLMRQSNLRQLESLPLLYAVNEQFESGDKKLRDQDVLAMMTPVAGG